MEEPKDTCSLLSDNWVPSEVNGTHSRVYPTQAAEDDSSPSGANFMVAALKECHEAAASIIEDIEEDQSFADANLKLEGKTSGSSDACDRSLEDKLPISSSVVLSDQYQGSEIYTPEMWSFSPEAGKELNLGNSVPSAEVAGRDNIPDDVKVVVETGMNETYVSVTFQTVPHRLNLQNSGVVIEGKPEQACPCSEDEQSGCRPTAGNRGKFRCMIGWEDERCDSFDKDLNSGDRKLEANKVEDRLLVASGSSLLSLKMAEEKQATETRNVSETGEVHPLPAAIAEVPRYENSFDAAANPVVAFEDDAAGYEDHGKYLPIPHSGLLPLSGPLHYFHTGPVPFSGNLSLRSESSTNSTRSFAFPVLNSDWNASPVQMAPADRRYLRRRWCSFFCIPCRKAWNSRR